MSRVSRSIAAQSSEGGSCAKGVLRTLSRKWACARGNQQVIPCLLMGWSGRAPAPPAAKLARGAEDEEHAVTQVQCWNLRDRYRYRQELVSCRRSRSAWPDRVAVEVVDSGHGACPSWSGVGISAGRVKRSHAARLRHHPPANFDFRSTG